MIDRTGLVTFRSRTKKRKKNLFKKRNMPDNKIINYYWVKELLLSEIIRNRYEK